MLALVAIFALPIIISLVLKRYKVTVFSALCAIPATTTLAINLMGYSFAPEVDYAIFLASILLCALCFIASLPSQKVIAILLCMLIVIPVIIFVTMVHDYSVTVTIDQEEYVASYCGFNIGPTYVSYHKKCNSVLYEYEPSFYSALLSMGSAESIGYSIVEYLEEGITEFYSSPEDAIDSLRDN